MKLSIIIPMYNAEAYISKCLESLLDQNLEKDEFEIIIINDGSIDNSLSVVKLYTQKHANILIVTQKNKGVGAARNKGVKQAKGKYIYFVDADDYLASNVFKLLIGYMETNNLDILGFNAISTEEINLKKSNNLFALQKSELKINNGISYIAENNYQNTIWWYIINKDFLIRSNILFIEGTLLEDVIFTAELISMAEKIAYLPLDVYRYVQTPNSIMRSAEISHYNKLINDYELIALKFNSLFKKLNNTNNIEYIKRIKSRQQSFIFFLMIRLMKSDLKIKDIDIILNRLKSKKLYPLIFFLSKDYNSLQYKILTPIFNNRFLYVAFVRMYRMLN